MTVIPVARPASGLSRWIFVICCWSRMSMPICRAVFSSGRTKPVPRAGVVGSSGHRTTFNRVRLRSSRSGMPR
jgi:hypothetical protein